MRADQPKSAGQGRREGPGSDPRGSLQATLAFLEQKWTLAIVLALLARTRRFTELAQMTPGLNTRTLSERLRAMEQSGIVSRQPGQCARHGVEYSLTEKGQQLRPVLRSIARWGRRWMHPSH